MPSTFLNLEIGRRALQTSQTALDVIGNNTANINTPGYSRQSVSLDESDPYTLPDRVHLTPGQLGTGVQISSITRARDEFTDRRVWDANAQQGAFASLKTTLAQVEGVYNEPGDTGLGQQITDFYNSFSDLSANPQSLAVRSTVVNKAQTLVGTFHTVSKSLAQVGPQLAQQIAGTVDQVSQLAGQIAGLNKSIQQSVSAGDAPNDLLDKRGQLINQLSQLVDVQVVTQKNPATGKATSEVNVNVGGYSLVQGESANSLSKTVSQSAGVVGVTTPDGVDVPLRGGQLYGLIKATTLVAGYASHLDTLAYNVVTATNLRQQAGYALDGTTNNLFFTSLTPPPPAQPQIAGAAQAISLDTGVQTNLNKIAAAAAPTQPANPAPGTPPNTFAPGNGDNARSLAALTADPIIGGFSLNNYYNAGVAQVGADSQAFQQQSDSQGKVVAQLQNQQASVSGVNLDEELTRMLQYQRSYQAAARVVNMADSFLNQIINGLGAGAAPTG